MSCINDVGPMTALNLVPSKTLQHMPNTDLCEAVWLDSCWVCNASQGGSSNSVNLIILLFIIKSLTEGQTRLDNIPLLIDLHIAVFSIKQSINQMF